MIGLKRYFRPRLVLRPRLALRSGLVASVVGHLGALIVGLVLVSANASHTPPDAPPDVPPPDAIVVDVVTPEEMPRFEGTPSNLRSSGSETPSPADSKSPVTQAPPPSQPQPETQQRPDPQQEAKAVPAPRPSAPEADQAELVRTDKTDPEKQNQSSEPQPAASPPTEQTPKQSSVTEQLAQYLALGPLGGGFAAPPVDTNVTGDDWTAPFRERVSACSKVPEEVGHDPKVTIRIRLSLNRDGTVASPPRLLVPAPSGKQQALMASAVDALERCQPFTMLPPEKYQQWKTMVFFVTPFAW